MIEMIIEKLLPFLYFIAGGSITFFSPYISEKITKRRRKNSIKYELIESVSLFFSYWRAEVGSFNYAMVYGQTVHLIWKDFLASKNTSENEITKEKISFFNEYFSSHENDHKIHYMKLAEIEAKLSSIVVELQHLYKPEISKKITETVNHIIEQSSDYNINQLHDYNVLSNSDLDALETLLPKQIKEKQVSLNKLCQSTITSIMFALKP